MAKLENAGHEKGHKDRGPSHQVPAEHICFQDDALLSWAVTLRRAADWLEAQEAATGGRVYWSDSIHIIQGDTYYSPEGEGVHSLTLCRDTGKGDDENPFT